MSESALPVRTDAVEPDAIPDGFKPLDAGGAYLRSLGPLYARRPDGGGAVVAIRVAANHLNVQGVTHGGMLTTLADGALGMNLAMVRGKRGAQVTVSLTADFLSGARVGEWLEAHVTVTRLGQRIAYASCDLKVGNRHILRSSAVFAFVDRTLPAPVPGFDEPPLADG